MASTRERLSAATLEFAIVAGREVVGLFDSKHDAEEWGEAYIGDNARWRVASFTDARSYEREVDPRAPRSPYARAGREGAHPRRMR